MRMIRPTFLLRSFLLIACTTAPVAAQDIVPEAQPIQEILSAGAPPVIDIDAALGADAVAALKQVYILRDNRPIWFVTAAAPAAHALLDRLAQPDVTVGANLQPLLEAARARTASADVASRAGADLLLTALYGATARALRPKEAPAGFAAALDALSRASDVTALLHEPEPPKVEAAPVEQPKAEAPSTGPIADPNFVVTTEELPEFTRLKAAIAAQKDWPEVPEGPKLALGDTGARVEALRRRLAASGDLAAANGVAADGGEVFDAALKSALEHFQAHHGLPVDGVAGTETLAALNVPATQRAAMLKAELKKLEGRNWGDRYLVVNLAAARFQFVDAGHTVAEGPAQVGAAATPTPLVDGTIDRVLLHPAWKIPQSIADRQLWPRQEEDATYFYNHGIHVTDNGLIQNPGTANPLGAAKLLLSGNDRFAVHGAPGSTDFALPERFTSSGCVALPDIAAVVKPLLAADPAWPQGRIGGAFAVGGTENITLAQPLPVHFVYDTAWVDEDGTVEFRDDIYGWDRQAPTADVNPVTEPCGS